MTMNSRRSMKVLTAAAVLALASGPMFAQTTQATQEKPAALPTLPTKVEVVISRYQGEKKVSSQPYVLMPSSDPYSNIGSASVRIGVDIPVGTTTTTRPAEANREGQTTTKPSYQNVGTNIDCRVRPLAALGSLNLPQSPANTDGRYSVYVSVVDSSIFSPDGAPKGDTPAIRTFQASNTMTMRDGQTMLLTTATDKVTGELLKIEVTFSLIK
jgi:hypothetical protein